MGPSSGAGSWVLYPGWFQAAGLYLSLSDFPGRWDYACCWSSAWTPSGCCRRPPRNTAQPPRQATAHATPSASVRHARKSKTTPPPGRSCWFDPAGSAPAAHLEHFDEFARSPSPAGAWERHPPGINARIGFLPADQDLVLGRVLLDAASTVNRSPIGRVLSACSRSSRAPQPP